MGKRCKRERAGLKIALPLSMVNILTIVREVTLETQSVEGVTASE